jgi:hypothetical protein
MAAARSSASWLSDDMAQALAAVCPPLAATDVLRAADKLSEYPHIPELVVVDALFRSDVDRTNLGNLIKALHALHDLV